MLIMDEQSVCCVVMNFVYVYKLSFSSSLIQLLHIFTLLKDESQEQEFLGFSLTHMHRDEQICLQQRIPEKCKQKQRRQRTVESTEFCRLLGTKGNKIFSNTYQSSNQVNRECLYWLEKAEFQMCISQSCLLISLYKMSWTYI